jgi:hypothetical protein
MIPGMKRALFGMLVVGAAHAAPAPKPAPITWADWVGSYDGKLAWNNCTAPGEKAGTFALEATDAVLSIDLAPAGSAFRSVSLVEEVGGWAAQQGDLKITITRPRADTLSLAFDLESGCTMRSTLHRATTGVALCDRLLGWARVEARCTKLHDTKLEDLAKLVATKWRKADADRCVARAAKLEASLIDVGCAPHPDPMIGVRAPKCMALSAASAKLSRCANIPRQVKDAIVYEAAALSSASQSAEPATLPYVEQQCVDATATMTSISTRFNCP